MKCYYAHPVTTYGSTQEEADLALLAGLGFEVVNPNSPEHSAQYRACGMPYFTGIVSSCDMLAFRGFPDGSIPAGVAAEIEAATGKPVIELPSGVSRRKLTVEQTKEALFQLGRTKTEKKQIGRRDDVDIYPHLVGNAFGESVDDAVLVVQPDVADLLFAELPRTETWQEFNKLQLERIKKTNISSCLEDKVVPSAICVIFSMAKLKERIDQSRSKRAFFFKSKDLVIDGIEIFRS